MDAREFEWESQLRFYWEKEPDELVVAQCTGTFGYGYEYMGLNGRLVITPLTDRIYLTLTQVKIQIIKDNILMLQLSNIFVMVVFHNGSFLICYFCTSHLCLFFVAALLTLCFILCGETYIC
jgi:hypothetical protein